MTNRMRLALLSVLLGVLAVILAPRIMPRPRATGPKLWYVSEREQRSAFGSAVRQVLNMRHFDDVEAMAETLGAGGYAYPSGVSQLHAFYVQGFFEVDDANDPEQWERHLARLREWNDARPQSVLAAVSLAQGLIGRAWAARGLGYAGTVSDQRWGRFYDDIESAGQILEQCPREARSNPEWWEARLQVLHARGGAYDSLYRADSREAQTAFPSDWHLYNEMAIHLMPRWFGQPGDWERFADSCARALPEPLGDEVYARILVSQARLMPNVFRDGGTISWERTRRGLEAWHRHFPASDVPRSALALLAWQAGQRPQAQWAFKQIGDTVDVDVWRDAQRFEHARAWANGDDALAAAP